MKIKMKLLLTLGLSLFSANIFCPIDPADAVIGDFLYGLYFALEKPFRLMMAISKLGTMPGDGRVQFIVSLVNNPYNRNNFINLASEVKSCGGNTLGFAEKFFNIPLTDIPGNTIGSILDKTDGILDRVAMSCIAYGDEVVDNPSSIILSEYPCLSRVVSYASRKDENFNENEFLSNNYFVEFCKNELGIKPFYQQQGIVVPFVVVTGGLAYMGRHKIIAAFNWFKQKINGLNNNLNSAGKTPAKKESSPEHNEEKRRSIQKFDF